MSALGSKFLGVSGVALRASGFQVQALGSIDSRP